MKILKFGGTSVGSVEAIAFLVEIVKKSHNSGQKPMLVCSAMSGVTNNLLRMAENASNGNNYAEDLDRLKNQHLDIISSFISDKEVSVELIEDLISKLGAILHGVNALNEISARTKDHVMSFGEQLSCRMITAIMQEMVGPTIYTDSRPFIITDNSFGNAMIAQEETFSQICQWYDQLGEAIPVITGFIASNTTGKTTTLGRGGSDYTASIVGAALNAKEIQIWTDVNGFMTADPRLVRNAFTLSELSYKEAMELSYFGAKVIYPPTLIPAISKNIPILIKNTFNSTHAGTAILPKSTTNGSIIKGISSIKNVSLINVEGNGMVGLKGFGGRLFGALAKADVNIILITQASSEHSISFAIAPDYTKPALEAIQNEFEMEIFNKKIEQPTAETQLSILAVVGENMRHTKGLSGKLFQSLGRSGVNVIAIAQGSSELNISVVIAEEDLSKALNSVHDSLFLSPVKTLHLFCAGTGNIGTELLSQLMQSENALQINHQMHLKVMGIINSRKMVFAKDGGIDLKDWKNILFEQGKKADLKAFIKEIEKMNLPGSIFIDNTSNQQLVEQYDALFNQNVSVVACNKLGASGPFATYSKLKRSARKKGVDFLFETNVGAGLPIIKTMNDLHISGDRFLKIEAILSGTISFIFNNYKNDRSFADVVLEAQQKGFTEPDPRDDLSGMDFSRKMLILARETGLPLEMQDVNIESILPEASLKAPSIEAFYEELKRSEKYFSALKSKAASENKVLRYIGMIEDGQIHIRLSFVGLEHPFYSLSGSDNIISFTTLRYKNTPLVVKGPGAGAEVTATGVFADILRVASF
ncbi:MAG: bifunctional aspartate kinase/homoserine dehydrogenase I [Bacteroidetes bacterium HGW-Bacteroidetes-1]|jgi:aspartokinase/homoserine dehydrogenase 1|nr:MAG: bifunctional aspartate kinase/homoserine dehydrogenase I [Bacteroidetes bacterium HGW-Bacteroidetes-1]